MAEKMLRELNVFKSRQKYTQKAYNNIEYRDTSKRSWIWIVLCEGVSFIAFGASISYSQLFDSFKMMQYV